ncbi:hypothetical protein LTR36_010635 [Oleoguttula mirabilis]|uniref:Uncharacterized protein n=1 Tax=Oleoguttula mirabilis TaxID=1507867 RepID=A0AAV9JR41_9PEZI|nr:hypothetical protein LTR36_010635 [Oleoguttula mirabilis]
MDFEDSNLLGIDRQTWNVFRLMENVAQLDLASLHDVYGDDFVRQNPARLFPAVTDLRLLGWMHRGLVKAILTSLDASKLRSLKLDYLQDEGALPEGAPINMEFAIDHAHNARRTYSSDLIGHELLNRQETGKAIIFPGPMWLPMHLLAACSLDSLTLLQVKLAPFNMDIDLRSYHTLFRRTADVIRKARDSVETLVIVLGETPSLYHVRPNQCGTSRVRFEQTYRPWCIKMAASFLNLQLAALNQGPFPHLLNVRLEGFRVLGTATPAAATAAQLASTLQSIQDCPYVDAMALTGIASVDHRPVFYGYDCEMASLESYRDLLESS